MAGAPVSWCRAAHKSLARGHRSVHLFTGVQCAGSVLDRGLTAQRDGEGRWWLEGEAGCSREGSLCQGWAWQRHSPSSVDGAGSDRTTCRTGSGPFHHPRILMPASPPSPACCGQGPQCWWAMLVPTAVLVGDAGAHGPAAWLTPRCRCLTAFLPCPLQRRNREQRRAGAPAAHQRSAQAEGETPASPWSRLEPPARRRSPWPRGQVQRVPPVPRPQQSLQQVTRSLPRAFPSRPALLSPCAALTAHGMPWGSQPTLPLLGHPGTR